MSLTLNITSYQRLSPGQSARHVLEQGRCTIGRAPENDWVLADPEMVLSKSHCAIEYRDGDYYLTDTSTNGVYVNQSEQRLGRGNTVRLQDGDLLILGDYEIQVALGQGASASAAPDVADDLFGEQTEQLGLQNWRDGDKPADSFPASESEPLIEPESDPLGLEEDSDADEWRRHSEYDHLPSEQAFFQAPGAVPDSAPPDADSEPGASPSAGGNQAVIPDDWEDSLIFKSAPAADEPAPPAGDEDPFDFLDKPLEAEPAESELPPSELTPTDTGPLDLQERPAPDGGEPVPRDVPPAAPPAAAPEPRRAPAAGAPAAGAPAAGHGDGNRSMQAFLRGAGLQQSDLPAGVSAEVLSEEFGKLFRQTAQGMMELLRARSSIKNEFRIERTMVGPVANNPLKVLPTVEEAMKAMLTPRSDIWMATDRAIQEGFEDIRAHELAMIAGMQAALGQLLERFDPVQLEEELGQQSRLSDLMAGGRKARYWDAFTRLYGKMAARAEDDFQDLFRKEFARAYEEQLDKLRQR